MLCMYAMFSHNGANGPESKRGGTGAKSAVSDCVLFVIKWFVQCPESCKSIVVPVMVSASTIYQLYSTGNGS